MNPFRSSFAETIFRQKYAHDGAATWSELSRTLAEDVCGRFLTRDTVDAIARLIEEMKFIPGGRYLYYAGRPLKAMNNCYLLMFEEDTREEWANVSWRAENCLMTGGGIGIDYSRLRGRGSKLRRTGGTASGPISKMRMINEIGREVMQGGSRRSAIYASLDETHADVHEFLHAKDWDRMMVPGTSVSLKECKEVDFNWPTPLDMTNISVNYKTAWLANPMTEVFLENCQQAMRTGEPGFSFNFWNRENETLRNAPVAADTWVMTKEGYRQVGEIVGQKVTVWTGKQWALTQFTRTKETVPTVIVSMSGGRQITADPAHEFLVERYKGAGKARRLMSIDRIPAANLVSGDILHVSLPTVNPEPLSASAYTLGMVYGDGWFGRYQTELTLCPTEKQALLPFLDKTMIRSINPSDTRGFIRMYLPKMPGRRKDLYPEDIEHRASFLAGLFDADGSWDPTQNRLRLSSIHRSFLEGVRRELDMLGIMSSINIGSPSGYTSRGTWTLVVNGSSVSRFAEVVPTQRLKPNRDFVPYRTTTVKVLAVEPGKVQDVYCCDVGVKEHSFCAEGVIISNCTEVTSEDDSDVCNLGSLNMSRIETIDEFQTAVELATWFLACGTLVADLPYPKVALIRAKNRRLGLGLMGMHEWLLQRNYRYEVTPELHEWLHAYERTSDRTADVAAYKLNINRPAGVRAIAPTGTIGILAGTTTGIEPVFAVAYKRRYLKNGTDWHYQYVIDSAAKDLIDRYDVEPSKIESALDLAADWERRIRFQADVQDYVDHAISSTINLPAWGTELNNEDRVQEFAGILAKYAPRLRGFTVYPDGSRGGQPLTSVPYEEAKEWAGVEFQEHDSCKGGVCGI